MLLEPPAPGIVFTTRLAGNLRTSGGVDPAEAAANRQALSDRLGIPVDWATARQVHGRDVLCLGPGDEDARGQEADAIVVSEPDRPAAVFVADCVPIALSGPGVAAAVHAGWRGLCAGVIEAAVARAGPGLSAWIGPCIGVCCFEVGPEVAERFAAGHPSAPDCTEWTGDARHFDLRKAAAAVLEACGVVLAGDPDVPCTRCDPRFFSHRRDATSSRQALITWVGAEP
jgi:YfiH family protein